MKNVKVIHEQVVLGKKFKVYGDFENPLFLAKDVAEWIDYSYENRAKGIRKVSQMVNMVDEDERIMCRYNVATTLTTTNNVATTSKARKTQDTWFLTEDGLYEVLMQSRKPIAKSFKKQVKAILKDIRKRGIHITDKKIDDFLDNPDLLIDLLIQAGQQLKKSKIKTSNLK